MSQLVWAASSTTQSNQPQFNASVFCLCSTPYRYIRSLSRPIGTLTAQVFLVVRRCRCCCRSRRLLFRLINFVLIASKLAFTYTSMSNDNETILFIQRSHFFWHAIWKYFFSLSRRIEQLKCEFVLNVQCVPTKWKTKSPYWWIALIKSVQRHQMSREKSRYAFQTIAFRLWLSILPKFTTIEECYGSLNEMRTKNFFSNLMVLTF